DKSGRPPAREGGRLLRLSRSERADRGGLHALGALSRLELDLLVLLLLLEAFAFDGGGVDEDVSGVVVRRDEAEALFRVEPLDGTGGHGGLHSFWGVYPRVIPRGEAACC